MPVITTTQVTVTQNTSSTYIYDYNGTDTDLDTLTWSDNTTLFNIDSVTGEISDTATESETRTYSILITVSDGTDTDTDTFTYVISDTTNPTYSNLANNGTTAKTGTDVNWSVTLTDGYQLDYYIFSYNDSGSWVNLTVDISGTSYFANVTKNTTSTQGIQVCAKFYFNDTSENENTTSNSCFTVGNTAPTFNPALVAQSVDTENSLNYDINASDADSDTITYYDNTSLFNIDSSTGIIIDTPVESEAGVYTILITIGDGTDNTTSTFDYTIVDKTVPTISWIRQDELNLTVEADPTYLFNISDASGTNWTSVIFYHGLNNTYLNSMNTSWRYPASSKQPDRLRASNRNESYDLIENNAIKLYTDDIVSYGGHLYGTCVKPIVYLSGSTWVALNMSFDYHHLMEYHITIDRYVDIYKNHPAIVQLETFPVGKVNRTIHINLNIDDKNGTYPLLIYGCNNSIDPYTVDYTTDSNCAFYGTRTDFDTKDRTSRNSSYVHFHKGIDENGKISGTDLIPSDIMFMYFASNAPNVAQSYKLYYANNTLADNTDFNETYFLHTYSPSSWTNRSETPDVQFEVSGDDYQVQYYVHACDNVSNCVNFTIQLDSLGARANEAPTAPYLIQPLVDYNISGDYNITWTDGLDPDCDPFNITLILINHTDDSEIVLTSSVPNGTEYYQLDTTAYTDSNAYQIVIYANDSGGLSSNNDTSNGNFTIDNTNPLIDFDTGTLANNSYKNRTYIFTNWTFTEVNLKNITTRLYNSTSLVNETTFTTSTYEINWTGLYADEIYYYNITIYDTASNNNETETRKIRLDSVLPIVNSAAQSPGTVYSYTSYNFYMDITDNSDLITAYIQFYINNASSGGIHSKNVSNNTNTLIASLSGYLTSDKIITEYWISDNTLNTSKVNTSETIIAVRVQSGGSSGGGVTTRECNIEIIPNKIEQKNDSIFDLISI